MSLAPQIDVYAAAVVPNAGASGSLSVNSGKFDNAFVRNAAGIVTVTLNPDDGVDASLRAVLITPFLTAAGASSYAVLDPTSTDTSLIVRTFDFLGAALDAPFQIVVFKKR
jgi:hypothetical protein